MKAKFWQIQVEDLKKQVEGYKTLKIHQSYRGISSLLLVFSMVLGIVFGLFKLTSLEEVLYSLIIYIPLAILVYFGNRAALVVAMLLWTVEKGFQLANTPQFAVSILLWWVLFEVYFYKAFKVELERRKTVPAPSLPSGLSGSGPVS